MAARNIGGNGDSNVGQKTTKTSMEMAVEITMEMSVQKTTKISMEMAVGITMERSVKKRIKISIKMAAVTTMEMAAAEMTIGASGWGKLSGDWKQIILYYATCKKLFFLLQSPKSSFLKF